MYEFLDFTKNIEMPRMNRQELEACMNFLILQKT